MVQVTKKPVNFTEEAKELFFKLPYMVYSCRRALSDLVYASDKIQEFIDGVIKEEDWNFIAVNYVGSAISSARFNINTIWVQLNDMVVNGLLREDLDITKELMSKIKSIVDRLDEIKRTNIINIDNVSDVQEKINKLIVDVDLVCDGLMELSDMYHRDPPEMGNLLSLGKILGIGIVSLLMFGAVLKYLPEKR